MKTMALLYQLTTKLRVIINFPIVDNPDGSIFVADRLSASRQVDNTQAAASEANTTVNVTTLIVWTTMNQHLHHPVQIFGIYAGWINDSANATHDNYSFAECVRTPEALKMMVEQFVQVRVL
jgi:hypothetical protein